MTRRWNSPALAPLAVLATLVLATAGCAPAEEETAEPTAPDTGAVPAADAGDTAQGEGAVAVDPALPTYTRASGISGSLSSVGSDTLNNLMTLWAEGFRREYPGVRIQIEGKGSSTAPPALIEGTAQLGPMSREMKPSEVDAFEERFGYQPTRIRVAIDALAVYVHRDNPLERLTIPQVDALFSKSRTCGHAEDITTWGDAGLGGDWARRPVSLYGRNSASGTYGYFKENALCDGDFKDTVKEQPGSASVVNGVTGDLAGIGYSGIGYKTSGVKALALAGEKGAPYYGTDTEAVLAGEYPLARFLYVYVNKAPNQPPDPLVRELIAFVLSQEGQRIVVKDGYLPLPAETAAEESAKVR
ncbi:MAG TPA: phosphate ABC transporter substrate-binding protein [Thermoanaerobaculia bacterium]|nr:phosphate ABC transporter substrate-binding protein [Thermoanaerobaculia bacterium]